MKIRYVSLSVAVLMLILGVSSLSAQGASSIAQGFQSSDSNVVSGALVSLKANSANTVELSTPTNLGQLVGIIGIKSLIELGDGTSSVQVVTSGATPALVSDINGNIKTGDKITASPLAGVGMLATTSGLVIGTAESDLSSVDTHAQTLTDTHGKQRTVHVGSVPVQVDKVYYQGVGNQNTFLPPAIEGLAASVAGHQVSSVRILAAVLLIALLFTVVSVLLYSAVRASLISIGRNPLSEQAVHKGLLEVGVTIVGVLVFTVIVVFLILTT